MTAFYAADLGQCIYVMNGVPFYGDDEQDAKRRALLAQHIARLITETKRNQNNTEGCDNGNNSRSAK